MKILNSLLLLLLFHVFVWSNSLAYPMTSKSSGEAKFQKVGDLLNEFKSVFKVKIDYDSKTGKTVTGIVYDVETSEPMSGATVLLKGTSVGVLTDIQGKFLIEVPDEKSVLVFSFVGYDSHNVTVGDDNEIEVKMKMRSKSLGEVMVVGYGSQKKSDITRSVSSAIMKDIEKLPPIRIDQSLQGRVSGIVVQNTDASSSAQVLYGLEDQT